MHKYTEDEKQFLRDNIDKYPYSELTDVFNAQFDAALKPYHIIDVCVKRMGLRKEHKQHDFSDEEKEFLRENIDKYTYPELTKIFNTHFKTKLKEWSISDICLKRLGIKRNCPWKFPKGRKDFVHTCPVGTERAVGRQTYVKVSDNVNDGRTPPKGSDENWKEKQILIYEKAYGKIPDDGLIVFLDKDRTNFDIKNLCCINRKINFMMAKNGWYNENPEITLTAIKWCELFYALKTNSSQDLAQK